MISYGVYKVIHLVGVLMVFLALGGAASSAAPGKAKTHPWKRPIAMTHGIGLLLSLVGGFGLLARLGIVQGGLPGWVWAKLTIWTLFSVSTLLLSRKPSWSKPMWILVIFLGACAAYIAGFKPL